MKKRLISFMLLITVISCIGFNIDYFKNLLTLISQAAKEVIYEETERYDEETTDSAVDSLEQELEKLDVRNFFEDESETESGSSSVNDIVDIMKSGNMTADGRNIITQLDENTKVIFRMDVGENAHSMEMYGYSNPVNHINIEIQVKASSGKYKPKWNFHMILDNLGEVSDSFATGIWTKK